MNDKIRLEMIDGRAMYVASDGTMFPPVAGSDDAAPAADAATPSEGDAGDASATGREVEERASESETPGTQRAADDKGEKGEGISALQKRLSTTTRERNEWRKLGKSPEEVLERLERAERVERAVAGRASEQGDPEAASAAQRRATALRGVINETFGDGADEDFSEFRESRRMQVLAHANNGVGHLRAVLEDHNFTLDDAGLSKWERRITDELRADPELLTQYHNPVTQREAIEEGFKRLREDIVDPALAVMGAGKLAGGARRRAAALGSSRDAGIPSHLEEDTEPPKTMKDPDDRAAWHHARIKRAWDAERDAGPLL